MQVSRLQLTVRDVVDKVMNQETMQHELFVTQTQIYIIIGKSHDLGHLT